MTGALAFDPILPWPFVAATSALFAAILLVGLWRGLPGWPWRAAAAAAVVLALSGPALERADTKGLADIVVLLADHSTSQTLGRREDQTEAALAGLTGALAGRDDVDLRVTDVTDAPDNGGTRLLTALTRALAGLPADRVAGIIVIGDGQIHDAGLQPTLPAPLHVLLTGDPADWDRRIVLHNAPEFAIVGEPFEMQLELIEEGRVPPGTAPAALTIAVDGVEQSRLVLSPGERVKMRVTLPHAGANYVQLTTPQAEGELTGRNNQVLARINGVRDRLRVLLISGKPHQGTRTWRNLLKSDSIVDLVHFTILRPPEKPGSVPVDELSLIAFPTRELFVDKIDEFDLIIFDRFARRGILPAEYLGNIRAYVENGGALLVAAGPEFATANSLYYSDLAPILSARPTSQLVEGPFLPSLSAAGLKHPVSADLATDPANPGWGRWLRRVGVEPLGGDVLMNAGTDDTPLLVLGHFGAGRSAVLASDQAWLWARGYDGGGPQQELLRRLAHWLMAEPELDEEALIAEAGLGDMTITRRTLGDAPGPLEVQAPTGAISTHVMDQIAPGRFHVTVGAAETGLYTLRQDGLTTLAPSGPAAPLELASPMATANLLGPLARASGGGVFALSDGLPAIRWVSEGRVAAGRGWMGLTRRGAHETLSIHHQSLLPPWLALALIAAFAVLGWLREGRR